MFRITFEGPKFLSATRERKELKEKIALSCLQAIMNIPRYHSADEKTIAQKAWELGNAMLEAYPKDEM